MKLASWLATRVLFSNLTSLMIRFPRCFVIALAGSCALSARAGEIRLPPITGQLGGEVIPLKIAGVPRLHWTVEMRRAEGGAEARYVEAKFEGAGTRLRVAGNFTTVGD